METITTRLIRYTNSLVEYDRQYELVMKM
jgi:hypothetical protein